VGRLQVRIAVPGQPEVDGNLRRVVVERDEPSIRHETHSVSQALWRNRVA
jgi:hypothetical protein